MQINNNNNNVNFSAIYRLPHTNTKFIKEYQSSVLPMYSMLKGEPSYGFIGSSPYEAAFVETLEEGVKLDSCSYEWLLLNARNHGINLPDFRDADGWIFTGMRDMELLKKFMFSKKLDIITRFKQLFNGSSVRNLDLPQHLNVFKSLIKMNERNSEKFQTLVKDQPVITVKDSSDLMQKMAEDLI